MNDDEFKKLLKKAGDATTSEYPKGLFFMRWIRTFLWSMSRTKIGCFLDFLILVAVVYFYGKFQNWW